ncbi:MAG: hypothetical protein HYX41_08125 [Bdellovibrio sp.]|nr:hypothetical protein [Bdellovibrio sp.]
MGNKNLKIAYLGLIATALGLACIANAYSEKKPSSLVNPDGSVWVSKSDGALSCEPGSGQLLEKSVDELKKENIHVLDARKGNDGKMHIQMCGASVGTTIQVRIPKEDLAVMQKKGFDLVRTTSERR